MTWIVEVFESAGVVLIMLNIYENHSHILLAEVVKGMLFRYEEAKNDQMCVARQKNDNTVSGWRQSYSIIFKIKCDHSGN